MSEKNFHFQNSNYQGFNIFNVLIFITLISMQLFSTLEFSRVVKICIFSNCETFKISTFHITPFNPRMFQIFKKFQHLNFYYCKTSYYILPNCILPLTITKPRQNTKLSQHFQDNNLFFIFSKLPIVTGNISQKKKKIKSRTTCYSSPFLMNTFVHPISTFQPALPSLSTFLSLCSISLVPSIESSQPLSSILKRWFCKEKTSLSKRFTG